MKTIQEIEKLVNIPLYEGHVKILHNQSKYVSGEYIISTANRIFGLGNWDLEVLETQIIPNPKNEVQPSVISKVRITVRYLDGDTEVRCTKVEWGAGVGATTQFAPNLDIAIKTSVTDGMKRCFKNFGDQFALCLYDKDTTEIQSVKEVKELLKAILTEAFGEGGAKEAAQKIMSNLSMEDIAHYVNTNPEHLIEIGKTL